MAEESKITAEFISEAEEIIEEIHKDLFKLEDQAGGGQVSPDTINSIFRGAHSLKGLAGMFGFGECQGLSHDLEHLLDSVRLGKVDLGDDVVALIFEGVEALRRLVAAKSRDEELPSVETLRRNLIQAAEPAESDEAESPAQRAGVDPKITDVLTEYEEHRLNDNIRHGNFIHRVTAGFELETFDTGLADITEKLKEKGEILTTLPSGDESGTKDIVFDLIVGTAEPLDALRKILPAGDIKLETIVEAGVAAGEEKPAPRPGTAKIAKKKQAAGRKEEKDEDLESVRSVSQTVRVDISRLDELMNIVGELVVQRNTFAGIADRLRDYGMPKLAQALGREVRTFERKIHDMQSRVIEVRMVPINQIFERLARVVRKVARSEKKEIALKTYGGDTELDKLLIEDLADPLMHLIRNAIDHGIEPPLERGQAGKPITGHIELRAYPEGNHVVIEVADDGRGINVEKVRLRGIERGLISPGEEITEEDVVDLICMPGFSTRDEASELSGRGVGMDVVKSNIAAMSGILEMTTKPGEGTRVKITLPITLAIIGGLVVEAGDRTFVIPVNAVQQCMRVTDEDLRTIEGRRVMDVESRTVPVISLAEFFNLQESASRELPHRYVVLVGLAEKRIGILVDVMRGQQDIVIKPVGELLQDTPGIAGATELGGQNTVLVLDVGEIIEGSSGGGPAKRQTTVVA